MDEILFYIMQHGITLIYGIIFFIIIKYIIGKFLKNYHSNWNTLIDDFEYSTEEFYLKFKKELLSHGVSGITASDISLFEGNFFSSRRRYIRIRWKEYQYDICAAPFGKGFFISWWLIYSDSLAKIIISKIPFVGAWMTNAWFPITYYRVDTASMFMSYAQSSVLKVIDDIIKNKGVRALTEAERKPMLNDVFKR